MGWRYQYILIGRVTFVLAIIRVFFMKMEESPKWLVSQSEFDKEIVALREISRVNQKELSITSADFEQLREVTERKVNNKVFAHAVHIRGPFSTTKLAISTSGITVLWMCIGIAYVFHVKFLLLLLTIYSYPIYKLFLPIYLENNGTHLGDGSTYQT